MFSLRDLRVRRKLLSSSAILTCRKLYVREESSLDSGQASRIQKMSSYPALKLLGYNITETRATGCQYVMTENGPLSLSNANIHTTKYLSPYSPTRSCVQQIQRTHPTYSIQPPIHIAQAQPPSPFPRLQNLFHKYTIPRLNILYLRPLQISLTKASQNDRHSPLPSFHSLFLTLSTPPPVPLFQSLFVIP